jgi:coenzyme Q-binding protein COQ10
MPIVHVVEVIEAPFQEIWDAVCDIERYPEFMDVVREMKVLDHGPDWAISSWSVQLKGSVLNWEEKELRDLEKRRVSYEQREGDLEQFSGYWQFEIIGPETTRAELYVDFEIGIPMLREMLDPVATKAIEDNSRRMLRALARRRALRLQGLPEDEATARVKSDR